VHVHSGGLRSAPAAAVADGSRDVQNSRISTQNNTASKNFTLDPK